MATEEEIDDRIAMHLFNRYASQHTTVSWSTMTDEDKMYWRRDAAVLIRKVLRGETRKKDLVTP